MTPPVPSPPPSAPASPAVPTAPVSTQPAAPATPPDAGKTFTQDDVDRMIKDRLEKDRTAQNKRLAEAFGITDPNAPVDPAAALKTAQEQATAAVQRADLADARSLAALAGVSKEHVDTFLKLVNLGPLKDIDRTNPAAVTAAIQQAVDAALTTAPMFKGSALPAASGGDRTTQQDGKRVYTRAELKGMTQQELGAISADLQVAAREGRITG